MKNNFDQLRNAIFFFLFASSFALIAASNQTVASTQNLPAPREEQLLNNLKVLVWAEPSNANVIVKLRIDGGAAFDVRGKEGTARLLADVLFPDDQTRQFVEEELGGSLKVECNYDFIEITAKGRADEFERVLETVRSAILNLPITPENFKRVQAARLKIVQTESLKPENVADAEMRKKLLGDFPYGRPMNGTTQSIQKIDRTDLLQARERLLTADNATLAIIGNVKENYALRAARQFFGSWQKSDKAVPATFRQPDAPNNSLVVVKLPNASEEQIRFALRGAARNAPDFAASEVAAQILGERWQKTWPSEISRTAFVNHEPHVLPGLVIFGIRVQNANSYLTSAPTALNKILTDAPIASEVNQAKSNVITQINENLKSSEAAARFWLDAETYKFDAKVKPGEAINAVTLAQVQDVLANWRTQTFVTTVAVREKR